MGHSVDIFATEPPSSYICAICHDVLQNAVVMKECGHSFCNECANECVSRKSCCPNCRTAVSGTVPNFPMRELVNELIVKCPHRESDGSASKHRRGNDGEVIKEEGCTWTGTCGDFSSHEAVCEYKVIICGVGGCGHTCSRKDMNQHLTGSEFLRHIKLVEYTLTEKHRMIAKRDKEEIKGLHRHVRILERRMEQMFDRLNEQVENNTSKIARIEEKVSAQEKKIEEAVIEFLQHPSK